MKRQAIERRQFTGFERRTFRFLKDLGENNNKRWFDAHRKDYEEYLLAPLRALVTDLADFMLDIDLSFEVAPSVNRTISRIYRDTRFSSDKSPFRNNAWIVFKRPGKDWSSRSIGYFLEINATWYRYGLGFYDAAADIMAQFRRQIDEDPQGFLDAIAWFEGQDVFELEGETYKRLRGVDKPEPLHTWYNYKSFYLSCNRKIDKAILSEKLVDDLMYGFGMTAPLYRYMLATIQRARPGADNKLRSR
ncbi:MAG TPA: DUF2461 domain-containing protein [Anaerohalosphaeraceae bacterium]|jgi:uncharacterized protein (TIGR02453 family)|nr:DUF2461 domain-containing protein [Anaerohalosphaeraceae bacterium]HRT52287.1 DUF2461 domain-containing protein [Anaerohalosphaeraceae bacterium]HRT88280.1 DUF2461 domain-containing protein [Anaerohalosphaeraceae bacterium]